MALLLLTSAAGWVADGLLPRPHVAAPASAISAVRMASIPAVNFDGSAAGEAEVELKVAKSGGYLIHRKVVAEQANMRLGTACTKTRGEVKGGGRKPYRQKGTGNARRGSSRSPLIVGGGVTFGPKPKSYHIKMNKKEKRLAISTALMAAVPKMTLIPDLEAEFTAPKTKEMKSFLDKQGVEEGQGTMVITKEKHENTYLSARNIPYLNLITLDNINARDILKAKKVLVSRSAMDSIKERYAEAA